MILLTRFIHLPFSKKYLFFEAMLLLLLARLALACLPFRVIQSYLSRLPKQPEVDGYERTQIRENVKWAVLRAVNYLPGKTVCFPRGIAAQAMLRRRRIGTTLYYGATSKSGGGLTSHVWVQDGTEDVTGTEESTNFKIVAKYPSLR